jgi:hypothetical protein
MMNPANNSSHILPPLNPIPLSSDFRRNQKQKITAMLEKNNSGIVVQEYET